MGMLYHFLQEDTDGTSSLAATIRQVSQGSITKYTQSDVLCCAKMLKF